MPKAPDDANNEGRPDRKIEQRVLAGNFTEQANHSLREKDKGSQNSPGDAEGQYQE
ncbi:hypothetical protein [Marinobacter halophilus]|uniref:hypothetical protein n=1 Tax=Marinobacter halophilus TaxID=1323740 RepID=UPI001A9C6941|nr:hypothetical protein [Marinobacter halophilus]